MKGLSRAMFIIAAFCAMQAASTLRAGAQTLEIFFKAQPFTIVVGYPPGAGYDLYARLIARHIGQYLPGTPKVIVQNMPGAGSLAAANHLFTTAKADGSVIGTFSRGITMLPIIDNVGVRYDPLKFSWIGSPSSEVSLALSWHTSPIKTFEDMRTQGMTVAASGPGSDGNIYGRVLNAILGTKLKIVPGYQGSADTLLAIERGEVDGSASVSYASLITAKKDWLDNKKVNILAQHTLKARPDLKGVPVILDFAATPEDRRVLELIFSRQSIGYPYAAPPGIPEDRLAAIRKAFDATLQNPEFLAECAQSGVLIDGVTGQEIEEIIRRIYSSPPEIIERAKAAMQPNG
jgi:tripartite-type tricarboxylate transporter receptor subunit TctC